MSVDSDYYLVSASSVGGRDGMALELTRDINGEREAEVFRDNDTGLRTLQFLRSNHCPLKYSGGLSTGWTSVFKPSAYGQFMKQRG